MCLFLRFKEAASQIDYTICANPWTGVNLTSKLDTLVHLEISANCSVCIRATHYQIILKSLVSVAVLKVVNEVLLLFPRAD